MNPLLPKPIIPSETEIKAITESVTHPRNRIFLRLCEWRVLSAESLAILTDYSLRTVSECLRELIVSGDIKVFGRLHNPKVVPRTPRLFTPVPERAAALIETWKIPMWPPSGSFDITVRGSHSLLGLSRKGTAIRLHDLWTGTNAAALYAEINSCLTTAGSSPLSVDPRPIVISEAVLGPLMGLQQTVNVPGKNGSAGGSPRKSRPDFAIIHDRFAIFVEVQTSPLGPYGLAQKMSGYPVIEPVLVIVVPRTHLPSTAKSLKSISKSVEEFPKDEGKVFCLEGVPRRTKASFNGDGAKLFAFESEAREHHKNVPMSNTFISLRHYADLIRSSGFSDLFRCPWEDLTKHCANAQRGAATRDDKEEREFFLQLIMDRHG